MYEKHYIIQCRKFTYGKWEQLGAVKYPTMGEAKRAMAIGGMDKNPNLYRIAESYVQVRYKPIQA